MHHADRSFDAVLFDWCGTLVEYPSKEDRFRPILQRLAAADHAKTKLFTYELAGLDLELAVEFESSYGDLSTYDTYPEVVAVIKALTASGVEVVIASDFHIDLRPHFEALGILDHIAGFAISCEVGATKPHPLMFEAALATIDAPAERCLMVGDNPKPDAGAAALGIATLILPVQRAPRPPLLERVLSLVLPGT